MSKNKDGPLPVSMWMLLRLPGREFINVWNFYGMLEDVKEGK